MRRGGQVPRALTLVVGPAGAPLDVQPAGGGLLLQVEDAVDGALQVLVQGVVRGAAAGEAGVVHVGGVRFAAFGRKERVPCEGGLWGGGSGGVLVHSERPSCPVSVFVVQPFVFADVRLLIRALLPPVLGPLPVEEQRQVVMLRRLHAAVEHLVHPVQRQAPAVVDGLSLGVQAPPLSPVHLHAGYDCPLRGRGGGFMPGGRGSGVGQTVPASSRDPGSDPGTDVFPVGFSKRQPAGGL